MAQQALRACELYKFWCLGSLRAKPRLLQLLVDYRDPDSETFHIDTMLFSIENEDIYFIIGVSQWGEVCKEERSQILIGEESILLTHVKWERNKVADAMANAGVESEYSFHAETKEDGGKTHQIWSSYSKLADDDARHNTLHSACEW